MTGGDRAAEVARLVGLGATALGERGGPEYGLYWTTLADPEGNEFCVGGQEQGMSREPGGLAPV